MTLASFGDRPPFIDIMRRLGMEPDARQTDVFNSDHQQTLLNCCRQSGKSTTVAILGDVQADDARRLGFAQPSAIARVGS